MKVYCTWLLFCLIYFAQVKSQRSGGNACYEGEIPCDNYECIPRNKWCDGDLDCVDRSDEQHCKTKGWFDYFSVNNCTEKHFECRKGPCVPVATRCDGFENCKDGSDEDDCDTAVKEEYDSEKIITEPAINTKTDDVFSNFFDNNNGFDDEDNDKYDIFDNDDALKHVDECERDECVTNKNFPKGDNVVSTTSETDDATSSPSYVASVVPVSYVPANDYYAKKFTESTNDPSNFDYNRAQNVHPRYNYNQQGSPSQIYENGRTKQTETSHTNSQYDSRGNTRNSSNTIVKLPPRAFPGTAQSSISDTYYPNRQHVNENDVRSANNRGTSVTLSSHTFSPAGQHPDPETRGNVRSSYSGDTIVQLPPRVFLPIIQPSDNHYANGQHINENELRSGYSSRASVASSTHTFPPIVPSSIPRTSGNEAIVRSGQSDETIIRLPPRIFFPSTQPSTSDTYYANSRHGKTENDRSREQGRTLKSSADYSAVHLHPSQHADHDNSAYGVQSDSFGQPENVLQRNRRGAPFYFRHNYTAKFGHHYKRNVQEAKDWILSHRNVSYGWGKDTPRALIALSLITNSFSINFIENQLMKKSLATGFGIRMHLLRQRDYSTGNTDIVTNSTMATYVNALLATCQDPTDFFGNDVRQELVSRTNFSDNEVNPLVHLTLCLTDTPIEHNELQRLQSLLTMRHQDERSSDMQILATTALACFQRQDRYKRDLERVVKDAFNRLVERKLRDHSFGSKYTTALAAQALMSIDTNEWRDARKTLDFLAKQQLPDGSFGDMLATYLIVPALSGRSLLHLRNTECDPVIPHPSTNKPDTEFVEGPGPKKNIYYTIKVGYPETYTVTTSCLEIGVNKTFLFAMGKAQHFNSQFRFLFKVLDSGETDVHTIIDIPNDTERGFRWRLFRGDARQGVTVDFRHPVEEDVAKLVPKNYEEFVYWYLPMLLK